jgi:hypothetical protein
MIDHTSYVDALLLLAALGSLSRHKAPKPLLVEGRHPLQRFPRQARTQWKLTGRAGEFGGDHIK